jgi:ABC-type multidrug transport system fused ATPase/permease subunit
MDRVTKTRQKELVRLRSLCYWASGIDVLWAAAPMLAAGASFTVYALTSSNSFSAVVSLSTFNLLRHTMDILPSVLTSFIRAIVSFKRVKKLLNCEELDNDRNNLSDDEIDSNDRVIHSKDCTYK